MRVPLFERRALMAGECARVDGWHPWPRSARVETAFFFHPSVERSRSPRRQTSNFIIRFVSPHLFFHFSFFLFKKVARSVFPRFVCFFFLSKPPLPRPAPPLSRAVPYVVSCRYVFFAFDLFGCDVASRNIWRCAVRRKDSNRTIFLCNVEE